jgi:hypothetical protein
VSSTPDGEAHGRSVAAPKGSRALEQAHPLTQILGSGDDLGHQRIVRFALGALPRTPLEEAGPRSASAPRGE